MEINVEIVGKEGFEGSESEVFWVITTLFKEINELGHSIEITVPVEGVGSMTVKEIEDKGLEKAKTLIAEALNLPSGDYGATGSGEMGTPFPSE